MKELLFEGLMEDVNERRHAIQNMLHEHVCEVTFTKVNGELRTMPCTLKPEAMPAREVSEYHKTRLFNPDVLSVFCTDKGEWRSFRVANVQKVVVVG